MDHSVDS